MTEVSTLVALSRPTATVTKSTTTATLDSETLPISDTSNILIGMKVSGTNIEDNTIVTAITTNTNITMSKEASGNGATGTLTFTKTAFDTPTNPELCVSTTSTSVDTFGVVVAEEGSGTITLTSVGRSTLANCNATQNSNVVTLSSGNTDSLYVGQSVNGTGFTGTQARIERIISSTEFALTEKASANATNATYVLGLEHRNLAVTEGNRIKCFNDFTSTGVRLNSINLETTHLFVMIHSDDESKHHFAKVTELFDDDVTEDSFEFRPKLGNEIGKDVKFKLFSTPISNSITEVAVGLGIKSTLSSSVSLARPLFYFFDENLDKINELDHNKKYSLFYSELDFISGATDILSATSFFTTSPDFGTDIIDYGRHSLKTRLIDNLKNQDNPTTHTSNEGYTTLLDYTPFSRDACFTNARRDANDEVTDSASQDYTGPYRYLSYGFSKDKANIAYNVLDQILYESMGAKGTLAELKLADPFRILVKKIGDEEPLRIRHQLFRGNFNEFKSIGAKITSNTSGNTYATNTDHDLSSYLNVGDEVRVGTRIVIVQSIASISGKTQSITFRSENRLETESIFTTGSYTLANDSVLERRSYNKKDKTLLTDFPLVANRNSTLHIKFFSKEFAFLHATVSAVDVNKKLLTLSFSDKAYFDSDGSTSTEEAYHSQGNMLDYMSGQYAILMEKITGEIEKIENFKEDGLTQMQLVGRSNIRKLISPVINKNTLFSLDAIYSTQSPYNKLTTLGGSASCNFSSKTVHSVKAVYDAATVGDIIHIKHATGTMSFAGKVASKSAGAITESMTFNNNVISNLSNTSDFEVGQRVVHVPVTLGSSIIPDDTFITEVDSTSITLSQNATSNTTSSETLERPVITLEDFSRAETKVLPSNDTTLFKESNKNYMLNKALATNPLVDSTTSLSGASNKGLFFNSGVKITSTGEESDNLVGSSGSVHENAVGYLISDVANIKDDSHFQAILEDEDSNAESFDTINTLLDFEILENKSLGDGSGSIVKIAPYNPLTLGRVDINYANTQTTTFSKTNLGKTTTDFSIAKKFIEVDSEFALSAFNHIRGEKNLHSKPVYVNGKLLGKIIQVEKNYHISLSTNVTSGSATATLDTTSLSVGMEIENGSNAHIPNGTTIVSIQSNTSLTMSANATGTSSNSATFVLPTTQSRIYLDKSIGYVSLSGDANSSKIITNLSSTEKIYVGMKITSSSFSATATVESIDSINQVTMSENATTSAVGETMVFYLPSGTVVDKLEGHHNQDSTRESSKLTHELNLLNAGHLHGAKNISLIHPKLQTGNTYNKTSVLDFRLKGAQPFHRRVNHSGGNASNKALNAGSADKLDEFGTYQSNFGASIYNLINIEKGNYNKSKALLFDDVNLLFYTETLSKIKYYASAYRYNAGYYTDGFLQNNIIGTDICGLNIVGQSLIETFSGSPYIEFKFENFLAGSANTHFHDTARIGQKIVATGIPDDTFVGNTIGMAFGNSNTTGEVRLVDLDNSAVNATATSSGLINAKFFEFDNKKLIESRGFTDSLGDRLFEPKTLESKSKQRYVYNGTTTISSSGDFFKEGFSPFVLYSPNPFLITQTVGSTNVRSPFQVKDNFIQIDPKVARMFLFSNSDLLPYSSTRKDSLLNKNKTRQINNYSLLSINDTRKTTHSQLKDDVIGTTLSITNLDTDYQNHQIISINKEINSLKRFSLMRLTEVVYDFCFNQFDPENIPSKEKHIGTMNYPAYTREAVEDSSSNHLHILSVSGKTINTGKHPNTAATANGLTAGDIIVDRAGRYIGVVASIGTNTIVLQDNAHKTDLDTSSQADHYQPRLNTRGGTTPNGSFMPLYYITIESQNASSDSNQGVASLRGYNTDVNFTELGNINLLQMATMRGISGGSYVAGTRGDAEAGYGTDDSSEGDTTFSSAKNITQMGDVTLEEEDVNIILPVELDFNSKLGSFIGSGGTIGNLNLSFFHQPFPVFAHYARIGDEVGLGVLGSNSARMGGSNSTLLSRSIPRMLQNFIPIFLDRYDIDGGQGANVDIGMAGNKIINHRGLYLNSSSANTDEIRIGAVMGSIKSDNTLTNTGLHNRASLRDEPNSFSGYNDAADGVFAGFKPTLKIDVGYEVAATFNDTASTKAFFTVAEGNVSATSTAGFIGDFINDGVNADLISHYVYSPTGKVPKFTRTYQVETSANPDRVLMNANATSAGTETIRLSRHYVCEETATNGTTVHTLAFKDHLVEEGETIRSSFDGYPRADNPFWLSFVDLTGCYLVSEEGSQYTDSGTVEDLTTAGTTGVAGSHGWGSSKNQRRFTMNGTTPANILYVISHEIDTTQQGRTHILTVSGNMPSASPKWDGGDTFNRFKFFRIMQPNHTCFYNFSPKKIRLNEMSSKYTKKPRQDSTYGKINSFHLNNKQTNSRELEGENEAVLSMYVVVDSDSQTTEDNLVIINPTSMRGNILTEINFEMNISDGENNNLTNVRIVDSGDDIGFYLELEEQKEMLGVTSISETAEITIEESDNIGNRALIGSVVSVCREVEELIDEILEENDIPFDLAKDESGVRTSPYPYFVAPNFRGVDLFSAIKFLMIKKNQILIENNGVFEIKNDDDSNLFTQIIFSTANDDTRIYSYSREKSSFDFYNEIIVFGKSHKAIRKELKSIKKKGRKTLQVFENELTTQHDVDERASELLKIHNDNSFGLKLTVGHKGISQLRVGDIVTVEIPEENITRSEFIVLEIQHNLTGTMDLELGSYTKGLEDRFAELQIESRAVNNKIRENAFDDSQISFDFLNGINVNTIKVLARKKTVPSGSFTLGTNSSDSETLNTNTNALNIGVTTFTTLLEEEF